MLQPFEPIKKIAYDALQTNDPRTYEGALRNILFYIAKEEEYFKARLQYYGIDQM